MARFLIPSTPPNFVSISYVDCIHKARSNLPDPAAGASDDWYKGVLGSRFSYTTELRDTGRYGFVLPANQIKPSGEELWAAQTVMFKKMIEVSKE